MTIFMAQWKNAARDALRAIAAISLLCLLAACGGSSGGGSSSPTFVISGSVSHLDAGSLTIANGADSLTLAQGTTSFSFASSIANGGAYNVTMATQPAGENCVVNNGVGTISGANVSNISIVCNTAISAPVTLNVIPVQGDAGSGPRIFFPISMVGVNPVSISAVLDTGSAGTVLNAFDVFPPTMVNANGFVFPAGQTTINFNGILVTNVQASKSFGGQTANPTMEVGNIGFAQLSFGSPNSITTAVVPVLFVFQHVSNGVTSMPTDSTSNLVGVDTEVEAFTVAANAAPVANLSPCAATSTTSCVVASPFRAFSFTPGAQEGFALNQVTLTDCVLTPVGSCPTQAALVIGLDDATSATFSTTAFPQCRMLEFSSSDNERICSQVLPNVTIASGGAAFTGPAIFDSGEPQIRLSVPQGDTFPSTLPNGAAVNVTTPSGFTYQFKTGTGIFTTNINQNAGAGDFSNLAIEFFTQNSLLLNYSAGLEGWR